MRVLVRAYGFSFTAGVVYELLLTWKPQKQFILPGRTLDVSVWGEFEIFFINVGAFSVSLEPGDNIAVVQTVTSYLRQAVHNVSFQTTCKSADLAPHWLLTYSAHVAITF